MSIDLRPATEELRLVRGEPGRLEFQFRDADGDPVAISESWQLRVWDPIEDDTVSLTVDGDTDAEAGLLVFTWAANALDAIDNQCRWRLKDLTGAMTVIDGPCEIAASGWAGLTSVGSGAAAITVNLGGTTVAVTVATVPNPSGGDGAVQAGRAAALLVAPSMTPGPGDTVYWVARNDGLDLGEGFPPDVGILNTFEMGDGWEDNGDINVLVKILGETEDPSDLPWHYAHVNPDGTFTEIPVLGGTPVTVGCLGIHDITSRPALWIGMNSDGPFGGIPDTGAPTTDFEPQGVGSDDVFLNQERLTGTILEGCSTLTEALDVLKDLTSGGGSTGTIQRWGLASQERIGMLVTGSPIATTDPDGDWNVEIREVGQAIYDPVTDQWIATYTGRGPQNNAGAGPAGSIGASLSHDDGATWIAHPNPNPICPGELDANPTIWNGNEDPYIIKELSTGEVWRDSSGRAVLVCEQKGATTNLGINLHRSTPGTLEGWTLEGAKFPADPTPDWTSVASPVAFHHNGWLWMLVEGLNGQIGDIGIAASRDEGATWALLSDDPYIDLGPADSWYGYTVVPDDIILVDGVLTLLCHGQDVDTQTYTEGRFYTEGDPFTHSGSTWTGAGVEWTPIPVDSIVAETNTIMCFGNDPTKAVMLDVTATTLSVQYVVPAHVAVDSALTARVTAVESDIDAAQTTIITTADRVTDVEADIVTGVTLDGAQDLLIGRISPHTEVAAFTATTGDFDGPTPGGTLTLPDAVIDAPALPWNVTSSAAVVTFNPVAPVAGARLIGARVRLTLTGIGLTDIVPNVGLLDTSIFQPPPGRTAASDAWDTSDVACFATVQLGDAGAEAEQEVVLHLDPVVDGPSAGAYGLLVGWQILGGSPSIGAGTSFTVHSVDWTWDVSAEDPSGGPGALLLESVDLNTGDPATLAAGKHHTIGVGAPLTFPSAEANVGELVGVNALDDDTTITPDSGEVIQAGYGPDAYHAGTWPWAGQPAIGLWVAGEVLDEDNEPTGVYAWKAVALSVDAAGGGADLSDATPVGLGSPGPGTGTEASRHDHRHPMPSAADVGAATEDYVDDSAAAVIAAAIMDGDGAGGALSGTFPNPGLNTEAVQDLVGAFLAAGSGVSLAYDDAGNVLTIAVSNLAITETSVVGSQAAMLALTAQRGDVAVRTDLSATFILQGTNPATLSDWVQLPTPTDAVLSVNGQTGVVVIPSDSTAATPSLRTLGTTSVQAAAGNDARLSDERTPTNASVTNAKVAAGAAIALAKLADIANARILGNNSGGTGPTLELTGAQVRTFLGLATVATSGLLADLTGTLTAANLPNIVPVYGDGSDGNVTISGTTTLTRDMYYADLAVTGTLVTAGFRVFVSGTLSGNGLIHATGSAASGLSAGSAAGANIYGGGANGGAGTSTTGGSSTAGLANMLGGDGGAGGTGSSGSGGGARAASPPPANTGGVQIIKDLWAMLRGQVIGNAVGRISGGNGGGGGGGDATNAGGGGGGGAGVVVVAARLTTFTGTISANGGAGATRGTGNVGGGGGGAGGGVGFVTSASAVLHTTTVTGGAAGNGVGTGTAGTAGASGNSMTFLGVK